MKFKDSKGTISFLSRIIIQIPTISLATATMIGISRNLGPTGRGEVSNLLLFAAVSSSFLCTPIFLKIMNLTSTHEIKSYVFNSLFLLRARNVLFLGLMNAFLFTSSLLGRQVMSLEFICYLNILVLFYFVSSQIRDLLLRFQKNKIYGVDFFAQLGISVCILVLFVFDTLSATNVIRVFVTIYGLLSFLLIYIMKKRVEDFKCSFLFHRDSNLSEKVVKLESIDSFLKIGILIQLTMSKDLLFGTIFLAKSEFGLMSALNSFWVVIRFIRPSAVIQEKLELKSVDSAQKFRLKFPFLNSFNPITLLQLMFIALIGIIGFYIAPRIFGIGFTPTAAIAITGTAAEIFMMKCLFDLSTNGSRFSLNSFIALLSLQVLMLLSIALSGSQITIALIWGSSCIFYLSWLLLQIVGNKK
jgi:hypothetical protein